MFQVIHSRIAGRFVTFAADTDFGKAAFAVFLPYVPFSSLSNMKSEKDFSINPKGVM